VHGPAFASVIISALGFVGLLQLEEGWEVLVVTDIDEEERKLDAAASAPFSCVNIGFAVPAAPARSSIDQASSLVQPSACE